MLAYMTSDIGAQHTRAWAIVQDINMGRESTDGKAKLVYDLQHLRPLMEVLGVCRFPWLEVKFGLGELCDSPESLLPGSITQQRNCLPSVRRCGI